MLKIVRTSLAVLAVALVASTVGQAQVNRNGGPCGKGTGHACVAPEIDPAMGYGALALLGGAIVVIRGRRKA